MQLYIQQFCLNLALQFSIWIKLGTYSQSTVWLKLGAYIAQFDNNYGLQAQTRTSCHSWVSLGSSLCLIYDSDGNVVGSCSNSCGPPSTLSKNIEEFFSGRETTGLGNSATHILNFPYFLITLFQIIHWIFIITFPWL